MRRSQFLSEQKCILLCLLRKDFPNDVWGLTCTSLIKQKELDGKFYHNLSVTWGCAWTVTAWLIGPISRLNSFITVTECMRFNTTQLLDIKGEMVSTNFLSPINFIPESTSELNVKIYVKHSSLKAFSHQWALVPSNLSFVDTWTAKSWTFKLPNTLDQCGGPFGLTGVELDGTVQETGLSFIPININPPPSVWTSHQT